MEAVKRHADSDVIRQKRNARYEVLEHHKVKKSQGVLSDQTIRLTGAKSQECPIPLRRIAYRDAATGKPRWKHHIWFSWAESSAADCDSKFRLADGILRRGAATIRQ